MCRGNFAADEFGLIMVIITANDYGKNATTTGNILKCRFANCISSAIAKVFIDDSIRVAALAWKSQLELDSIST